METMKFSEILDGLKKGKVYFRQSKKGDFIFRQVPAKISVKEIVPNMQSLPKRVKKIFADRAKPALSLRHFIYYRDQLAVVDANNVIRGYTPTVEDVLATDWMEYKVTL